jgi:hypothetical protein
MSNFVYLPSDDLLPLFLRTAKSAPPTTRPPNNAMITIGSDETSEDRLPRNVDTGGARKVPKFHLR